MFKFSPYKTLKTFISGERIKFATTEGDKEETFTRVSNNTLYTKDVDGIEREYNLNDLTRVTL